MRKEWFGVNYPFVGGNENILSRQIGTRLIKNDLLQLILTNNGERVMRPLFGGNLRNNVFDQMSAQDLDSIRENLIANIRSFEPRVDIMELTIDPKPGVNQINIRLVARLRDNPDENFNISVTIPGAPA